MLKRSALRRLLPAGLVTGVVGLAFLLPAAPLAALFVGYSGYFYGGVLSSGPGTDGAGTPFTEDVFVSGQDLALYTMSTTPSTGAHTNFVSLGGVVTSDPGATKFATGDILAFVRGQDNGVYYKKRTAGVWGNYVSLGGRTISGLEAENGAIAGTVDVFIKGQDSAVYEIHSPDNGATWGNWMSLGGVTDQDVGVVTSGAGHEDLFIRGQDNAIWWKSGNGNTFGNWTSLGGVLVTGVGAASCSAGHMDIFAVGQDFNIYTRGTADNGATWSNWLPTPGLWTADPGAECRPGTTTIDLWDRGRDFALYNLVTTFGH